MVIKIKEGRLITDLYCKPTDGHHYLHYDSCHADYIKRSIIFSQTLRSKRISSVKNDLNVHVEDLKIWFRKRGYPDYLIKEQVERALSITPSDEKNSKKVNGLSLVVTYSPALKNLSQVIRKNLQLLYADEQVKKVVSLAPFVSFKSTRNLKSYLVRSKIYPLERKVGSEKCKSKCCLVCLNVSETDVFQSFQTKVQYKINHQLNCNNKCLIYLLSCKVYGLQYVGSTIDKFRLRWNNYKENNRKAK